MSDGDSAAEADAAADEADAAAADAEARAEAARARVDELRRKLADTTASVPAAAPGPPRRWVHAGAAAAAAVLTLSLLGGTGYMLWLHRNAAQERDRTAEFAAAGRQAVVNLMSMDYNTVKDSVQRIIEDSTGRFKTSYQDSAADLIKTMQEAKVMTTVTVNGAAVESNDADSGVVLVAATTRREDAKATDAERQPQTWRVVVTLDRDGGRLKLSDFGFS